MFGFANIVLPLQIGAPDVAFLLLNAFSFWLFVFGALIALAGFITRGDTADFGWTAYTPLTDAIHSPAQAVTCGSWAWPSPDSVPSSAA